MNEAEERINQEIKTKETLLEGLAEQARNAALENQYQAKARANQKTGEEELNQIELTEGIYKRRLMMLPDTEGEIAKLEQELAGGYKKAGKKKSERTAWADGIRERIMKLRAQTAHLQGLVGNLDEARMKQYEFTAEYINCREKTKADLRRLKEKNEETVSNYHELALDAVQLNGICFQEIINKTEGSQDPVHKKMNELATDINNYLTADKDKMGEDYFLLLRKYEINPALKGGICEEQLSKGAAYINEGAATLILSAMVNRLSALINQTAEDFLQNLSVSDIHALTYQLELISTSMLLSDDYREKLNKKIDDSLASKELSELQELKDKKELIEIRKHTIRTGSKDSSIEVTESWNLAEYAEDLIVLLGNQIVDTSDEQFSKLLRDYEDRLAGNKKAVEITVFELSKLEGFSVLESEAVRERATQELYDILKKDMLREDFAQVKFVEQRIDKTKMLERFIEPGFVERVKEILGKEDSVTGIIEADLKKIAIMFNGNVLPIDYAKENKQIIEALVGKTEAEKEVLIREYRENFEENYQRTNEWILRNATDIQQGFHDLFMKNYGHMLYTSSFQMIETMLSRLEGNLNVMDQNLDSQHFRMSKDTAKAFASSQNASNTSTHERLSGELLAGAVIFGGCFDECKNEFMKAFYGLAEKGAFEKYGVKAGSKRADIEALTPSKLRVLVDGVAETIALNLSEWMKEQNADHLEDMMSLDKEEYFDSVRKKKMTADKIKAYYDNELYMELLGERYQKRTVYSFKYEKISTAKGRHETRTKRRTARLERAKYLKDYILHSSDRDTLLKYVFTIRYGKNDKSADKILAPVIEKLNNEMKDEEGFVPYTEAELKELNYEFVLCEQEEFLATERAQAFQSLEHKEYKKNVADDVKRIATREESFWNNIIMEFRNMKTIPPVVFRYYENILHHISRDTDEEWNIVLNTVFVLLRQDEAMKQFLPEQNGEALKDKALDTSHAKEMLATRDTRIKRMRSEMGPVIDEILPYLISNQNYNLILTAGEQGDFEEFFSKVESTVIPAMDELKRNYSSIPEYYYQVLNACQKDIFSLEEGRTAKDWRQVYRTVFSDLATNGVTGDAIERLNLIIKPKSEKDKYALLSRYSDLVISATDFSVFADKTKFDEVMNKYVAIITQNEEKYQKFIEEREKEVTYAAIRSEGRRNAIKTTCFLGVKEHFLAGEITDDMMFEAWDYAMTNEDTTVAKIKEAEQIVEERRKKLGNVVAHKINGKEKAKKSEEEAVRKRELQSKGVPPIIYGVLYKKASKVADTKEPGMQLPVEEVDEDLYKDAGIIDTLYGNESEEKRGLLKQLYISSEAYQKQIGKMSVFFDADLTTKPDLFKRALDATESVARVFIDELLKGKKVSEEGKQKIITRLLGLAIPDLAMNADKMNGEQISKLVASAFVEFQGKMGLEGKLKQVEVKIRKYPILSERFERTMVALSYNFYGDSLSDYEKKVNAELRYLENSLKAAEALSKIAGDNQGLLVGLMDYFAEQIYGESEVNVEAISHTAEELTSDEWIKDYLIDSSNVFGAGGNKSMQNSERKISGSMNRETFSKRIWENATEKQRKVIRDYTVDDLKLFALLVANPGLLSENMSRAGMDLVYGEEKTQSELNELQRIVARYRENRTVDAEPDYEKALLKLTGTALLQECEINEEIFKCANGFIDLCNDMRIEEQVKMTKNGGCDPMTSVIKMHGKDFQVETPESTEDLVVKLMHYARIDASPKLVERLENVREKSYLQLLLVMVLQNRSMVDYTSEVSRYKRAKGAKTPFIDEEDRDTLMAMMGNGIKENISVNSELLSTAMAQAFSYKWKEGAIEFMPSEARKTKLDIDMLERALDFVDELVELEKRKEVVKTAATPMMIKKSGNQAAIDALNYAEEQGYVDKTERFASTIAEEGEAATRPEELAEYMETFIREQAKKDGKQGLLAGYLSLSEKDKKLFFAAIARRDFLDISKEDIWWNRFGLKDRDFVNAVGRNELIDQYLEDKVDTVDAKQVFYGLLSTQIKDSFDFSESVYFRLEEKAQYMDSARDTAIDWKLFQRALQLIQRTKNEKQIRDGQSMINKYFTKIQETGTMEQDTSLLRRNIHNSGTRFTRFLGTRVVDEIKDFVPDYLQLGVRMLFTTKFSNKVNDLKPFEEEDDSEFSWSLESLFENGTDLVEKGTGYLSEDLILKRVTKAIGKAGWGKEKTDDFLETVGNVSDWNSYIKNGKVILENGINIIQLNYTKYLASTTDEEDKERIEEEKSKLSPEVAEFLQQSLDQNSKSVAMSSSMAISRKMDEIFNASAELLSGPAEEKISEAFGGIIVKEAVHTINFIRSYCKDLLNIYKFFNIEECLENYRQVLAENGITEVPWDSLLKTKISAFCEISGYENLTELSEIIGMNMAQATLFSASDHFRGTIREKLVSKRVMKVLGLEDSIGDLSVDSAQSLYDAIMGSER